MANGTIVKYKKHYKITIEGKTDTKYPDEYPLPLEIAEFKILAMVALLDSEYKSRDVRIKEVKR